MHNLPAAKRLPTGPDEERELVQRHEVLAERLLSNGCECALVMAYANGYRGEDEPGSVADFGLKIADGWCERASSDPRFADDLEDMAFAVSLFTYSPKILAPLILDVAYGRTAPLLVFAANAGRVYSPYDGGADLFLENPGARDAAHVALSAWVSQRPDGL